METWLKISLILCTFGFFREMRPSEPYVTEFLSGHWRNITSDQVNREIYPLGTYSYLIQLVIIFLITDLLRYKPIIIVSSSAGIIFVSLLLWTYSLLGLQIVQLFYGMFMASEIAYYTYIYAKVERTKYQKVTGHTRSAILMGRFLASLIAQLLVTFEAMDFRELHYISLAAQCVSFIVAFLLPNVKQSLYFYTKTTISGTDNLAVTSTKDIPENNFTPSAPMEEHSFTENVIGKDLVVVSSPDIVPDTNEQEKYEKITFSCTRAYSLLWTHFKDAYSNKIILQWSIWWSLAMCGFLLVQSYVQLLWQEIYSEPRYNGAVEAALTLLGALGAFAAGFLNNKLLKRYDYGFWILTICSLLEGGLIIWSALTDNIWIAYVMYVTFGTIYHFMITIAYATVAKKLNEDSFALIFGINTLLALVLQTIMTVAFISEGFTLSSRYQFVVFGTYYLLLAIIYGSVGLVEYILEKRRKRDH